MTREQAIARLRDRLAAAYDALIAAVDSGDDAAATAARELAKRAERELEGLRDGDSSGNRVDVTRSQKARRGAGVARASAKKSAHPIRLAITASRWRSLTAYAKHLRVSQGALSRYLSKGDDGLQCPPEVADTVKADFGLGDDAWPRPPHRR